MFDDNISKPSGCFNPHTLSNESCIKDLEDNTLLVQNVNYLYFITIVTQVINMCYATTAYLSDVNIFLNEHDNRKYIILKEKLIFNQAHIYFYIGWYSTGSYFWGKKHCGINTKHNNLRFICLYCIPLQWTAF